MKYEITIKLVIDGKGKFEEFGEEMLDYVKDEFDKMALIDLNEALKDIDNSKFEIVNSRFMKE